MGTFLTPEDVQPLAPNAPTDVLEIQISDVEGAALEAAPCLANPAFQVDYHDRVKGILRQAVLRWVRAGDGGLSSEQMTSGPFSMTQSFDTRTSGEGRLLAGEVRRLQALCRQFSNETSSRRKAFTIRPGLR